MLKTLIYIIRIILVSLIMMPFVFLFFFVFFICNDKENNQSLKQVVADFYKL